jgi:hypothetical protein
MILPVEVCDDVPTNVNVSSGINISNLNDTSSVDFIPAGKGGSISVENSTHGVGCSRSFL